MGLYIRPSICTIFVQYSVHLTILGLAMFIK